MNLNPVQHRLDSLLFPYQTKWINEKSKYAAWPKSRRIGASWCEAIAAVLYSLNTGEDTWFSSSDEKNAREWVIYVKQFAEVINALLGERYIDLSDATTECVRLPNGTRLTCLSSNPTQFRGKQGRIVLDEFALHDDQYELYRAAQGCIVQRGVLRIISTHNGPTLFHELITGAPANGYVVHETTLEDACQQGYADKFAGKHLRHLEGDALTQAFVQEVKRGCVSEDAYRQEYCCQPISLQSLLTDTEYDRVALWPVPSELDLTHAYRPLQVGIDVGRSHDITCAWFLEEWENPKAKGEYDRYDYKTVAKVEIRNTPITTQFDMLRPMLAHPSVSAIMIDQGTVGRTLSDLICDDFPFATPMVFTNPAKARMAERVKGFVQAERVSLPKDEPLTKADLLSMRREVSKNGSTVVYNGGTAESHADRFWALALALEAATAANGAIVLPAA